MKVLQETEIEELSGVIESVISTFSSQVIGVAVEITENLVSNEIIDDSGWI